MPRMIAFRLQMIFDRDSLPESLVERYRAAADQLDDRATNAWHVGDDLHLQEAVELLEGLAALVRRMDACRVPLRFDNDPPNP